METVNHIRGRIEHEFRGAEGNFARQAAAAADTSVESGRGVSLGSRSVLTARIPGRGERFGEREAAFRRSRLRFTTEFSASRIAPRPPSAEDVPTTGR